MNETATFDRPEGLPPTWDHSSAAEGDWEGRRVTVSRIGLPVAHLEKSLEEFAVNQGVDFEGLLKDAGRHFESDEVEPRTEQLPDAEIERLVEDDRQAFDD